MPVEQTRRVEHWMTCQRNRRAGSGTSDADEPDPEWGIIPVQQTRGSGTLDADEPDPEWGIMPVQQTRGSGTLDADATGAQHRCHESCTHM